MANVIEAVFGKLPPVTLAWGITSTVMMVLCSLDVLHPLTVLLNWNLVFKHGQYWRLLTNFFFDGDFSIPFFWNLYLLMYYCSSLEEMSFRNRAADFAYFILCGMVMLVISSYLIGVNNHFLSSPLMDAVIYVWARKNPHARMQVLIFPVQARYLPWTLALVSLLMGGYVAPHLLGIFTGHVYYFFTDIYPYMPTSKGFRLFTTPAPIKYIFRQKD